MMTCGPVSSSILVQKHFLDLIHTHINLVSKPDHLTHKNTHYLTKSYMAPPYSGLPSRLFKIPYLIIIAWGQFWFLWATNYFFLLSIIKIVYNHLPIVINSLLSLFIFFVYQPHFYRFLSNHTFYVIIRYMNFMTKPVFPR